MFSTAASGSRLTSCVRCKGRWVTEEARAKSEESAQLGAAQTTWVRRIKLLRQAMVAGSEDRRREAEAELMQIREVEAVHPLVKVLATTRRLCGPSWLTCWVRFRAKSRTGPWWT